MQSNGPRSVRPLLAIVGVVLAVVLGFAAAGAGALTCHEDVGSDRQAPNLCHYGAGGAGQFLQLFVGPFALFLLAVSGARVRTLAVAVAVALVLVAEAGLVLMWALVSHGTIHY
jgi:hypothetical protein